MSAAGTWKIAINLPFGVQDGVLAVHPAGETFAGHLASSFGGPQEISGKIQGDTLRWSTQLTQPLPIHMEFIVTAHGDEMTGEVKAGDLAPSPLRGVRA